MTDETHKSVHAAEHANVQTALTAAQALFDPVRKTEENPAFKKDGKATKYAGLSSVVEAVGKALNSQGIAYWFTTETIDGERHMTAILAHGTSGTEMRCPIPLIVDRSSMHGYKSATTYAKRIGLESVTGVAPEDDDDGNDATKNAPTTISPEQYITLRDLAESAEIPYAKICEGYGAPSLHQFPADKFDSAVKKLNITIAKKAEQPADPTDMAGDGIPDFGEEQK